MTETEVKRIIQNQRTFFLTGQTLSIDYRKKALSTIREMISNHLEEIYGALKKDIYKSDYETYMCEVGIVLNELSYMQKHLKSLAKPKRIHTELGNMIAKSYVQPSPYGVCLIMSPWNYPILLTLDPLVDAIAAGNTAIIKPSAYSPETSALLCRLISQYFSPEYITTVTGGRSENAALIKQKFDYIFFTGSVAVGKEIMKNAAEYLTPVTLELGGKSPCIIDKSADIKMAAKRVVFGKFLNSGQTCVAPDYVLCHSSVKEEFIKELKLQTEKQYSSNPLENPDYGKIINEKHFERVCNLMDKNKIVYGGKTNAKTLQIEPTILDNVNFDDPIMNEEIFGPLLPILTFDDIDNVINCINSKPCPLALYVFANDKKVARKVITRCSFGGGCVNDTIMHITSSQMGFGGMGESGMGSYHGKTGFNTFSHNKSVIDKNTHFDLKVRYQPYNKKGLKLIKFCFK